MANVLSDALEVVGVSENIRPFPSRQLKAGIDQAQLINRLNRLNFKQEPLYVHLRHKRYDNILVRLAIPRPCMDEELECQWVDPDAGDDIRLKAYDLDRIVLADGHKVLQIEPLLVCIDGCQVTVRLPSTCSESFPRSVRRHACEGVKASMVANSAIYEGRLVDFSAKAFRVELLATPPQTFDWIGISVPVSVTLRNDQGVVYVGDCKIVRQSHGLDRRDYVLQPTRTHTPRFRPRECRSSRYELLPCPNAIFKHPLTHRTMHMKLLDISGSGFAVAEPVAEATLLPGMVIKEMAIALTSRTELQCTAQVIHRNQVEGADVSKVGLALVDIDNLDHMELVSLLQQAKDPDTYVSNKIDLDALWDFFFETGFIYPEKYASMVDHLESYKKSYAKLYTDHPAIARHFTHMKHGKLLGHFALLRLHEKTWVLHHHAALHNRRKSGLLVLDRLCEYINDTHALHSANIRFAAGFYRADNKFPVTVFGGFAKKANNPKIFSVDNFAYLSFDSLNLNGDWQDSGRWELTKIRRGDLEDLQGFYEKVSGGMLLEAVDMTPEALDQARLSEDYVQAGFKHEIHRLAIRKNGELKAVVAVNRTDIGLNFSELTNATKVFVVDSTGFSKQDFRLMMSLVEVKFGLRNLPLMVYPNEFLDTVGIPYEKKYSFSAMNLHYWDSFMCYLRDFMKRAKIR